MWLIVFAHGRYRPNPPSASRQTRMSPPSNDPRIIAGLADRLIEAMYQPGGVYTKCGVLLEELLPQGAGQGAGGRGTSLPSRIRARSGCWPLWMGSTIGSGVGPSGSQSRGSARERSIRSGSQKRPAWTARLAEIPVVR